jgi:hypothetical protein
MCMIGSIYNFYSKFKSLHLILWVGTLSYTQLETIRTLRAGILALAVQDREYLMGDVKVQNPSGLKTSNSSSQKSSKDGTMV